MRGALTFMSESESSLTLEGGVGNDAGPEVTTEQLPDLQHDLLPPADLKSPWLALLWMRDAPFPLPAPEGGVDIALDDADAAADISPECV